MRTCQWIRNSLIATTLSVAVATMAQGHEKAATSTETLTKDEERLPDANSSADVNMNIKELLNDIRRQRREILTDLRSKSEPPSTLQSSSPPPEEPVQHRKLNETRRAHADRDKVLQSREKRVRQQLSRLEELIREQAISNAESSAADVPVERNPNEDQPLENVELPLADDASALPRDADDRAVKSLEPKPDEQNQSTTGSAFSTSEIDAIAVTDQAVDRLALANNLYGTGEFALALKVYSQIDLTSALEADQIWVRYQIANCHRRLNNSSEAQRGFRMVTSMAGDTWWSHTSRWWLDTNDRLNRMSARRESLQQSLNQVRKEFNDQRNAD